MKDLQGGDRLGIQIHLSCCFYNVDKKEKQRSTAVLSYLTLVISNSATFAAHTASFVYSSPSAAAAVMMASAKHTYSTRAVR